MRRRNNEGSISFDKIRKTWRAAFTTPTGKTLFKRFRTEEEAKFWLNSQIHSVYEGTYINPTNIKVGEWMLEWLNIYVKDTVRQKTFERYLSLANHLNVIADLPLQKLKSIDVQKIYQIKTQQVSPSTIKKIHVLLCSAIKKACMLDMLPKNIMDAVQPPKVEKKSIEIFTRQEIEKILIEAKTTKFYAAILLAITTGMRVGEVLGLRWQDVNFDNCEIHVQQSLQDSSLLGLIFEPPKTKSSNRKIAITQETLQALKILRSSALLLNIAGNDLCFKTKNGTPVSPTNFAKQWKNILIKAKVGYKTFHVLRHTHATELLASNISIVEVARRLGHAKVSHTLDLYGQSIPNYDKGIADKVSQMYSIPV